MESQHQNPEFRNNPESFHPCRYSLATKFVFLMTRAITLVYMIEQVFLLSISISSCISSSLGNFGMPSRMCRFGMD